MQKVIALVGPTATGKSAVAVELAQSLGAEIVSCDSMQVYRQMAVLTQSPTYAQRAQVQHHLIDCIDPTHAFSVGEYRRMAAPVIDRLLAHGKRALIVGGTGLYLRAMTEGLCHNRSMAEVKSGFTAVSQPKRCSLRAGSSVTPTPPGTTRPRPKRLPTRAAVMFRNSPRRRPQ